MTVIGAGLMTLWIVKNSKSEYWRNSAKRRYSFSYPWVPSLTSASLFNKKSHALASIREYKKNPNNHYRDDLGDYEVLQVLVIDPTVSQYFITTKNI